MVESSREMHPVVICLEVFHTEMSFLGSTGHIMSGTGFQKLPGVAYTKNAVVHLLTGKAVSCAVRENFLIDAALNTMVASAALGTQLQVSSDSSQPNMNSAPLHLQCSSHHI